MNTVKPFIFGRKPIVEAIKAGKPIEKVMILQQLSGEIEVEMRQLSRTHQFQLQRVPAAKLDQIAKGENHQGIIAELATITYSDLETLLPQLQESGKELALLIIDGVEDVRNFGAIARSALAYEMDAIITFKSGNAKVNEVAVKTSAGALLHIPVCREESLEKTFAFLAAQGIKIFAASLQATTQLHQMDFRENCAIVMGSEQRGVSKLTLDYADQLFAIDHSDKMESLNVSVAAGIIFNQVYQNRK